MGGHKRVGAKGVRLREPWRSYRQWGGGGTTGRRPQRRNSGKNAQGCLAGPGWVSFTRHVLAVCAHVLVCAGGTKWQAERQRRGAGPRPQGQAEGISTRTQKPAWSHRARPRHRHRSC